jgi:histidine triad (HIT) family protein
VSCIFCEIAAKRKPSQPVFEDDTVYAFRDIHPQAPTHILIIPKKHVATLNDLAPEEAPLIGELVLKARELAKAEGIAERGYRLVVNCNAGAGQSVYHVHFHLLGGRAMGWPPG